MAELTPWTEVSASWMSVWGDEEDISIKDEEFDVQNGTNNENITFDIDSDLIDASVNIDKESNSTNATFVDICHGLDLDLAPEHHILRNVSSEEIVQTTVTVKESSSGVQLIEQNHIANNQVMTEQDLATEFLIKTSQNSNENLIIDMPLNDMYSSTSNLSAIDDVDQIIEEKIEINASDLIMDLNGHRNDLNQLTQSIQSSSDQQQQCLNDITNQQNNNITLSADSYKNCLHYVKYINRDGKHVKVWECGVCNKEFGHQYTLMRHLPTHTDERKFQCNTCGKAFRQMSTLSQHRAIHSTDRPYVCEVCRKTFNRVSTLISHRKTHSGLKPHQCHLCHKAFHQKGNLRNHIFTHTNERPYKCDVCQKGFNQMSNLMCHKLKAHQRNDKPKYMCRLCNKEFPKRMALRNHEEYKHGIKNQQQIATTIATSTPATSLSGLTASRNNKNSNDLLLQRAASGSNSSGDSNANAHPSKDKMCIIHIPEIDGSIQSVPTQTSTKVRYTNGVLVDAINTEAMRQALKAQQESGTSNLPSSAPFALLRPISGIPVLVRVLSAPNGQHMLVPATAEDLKTHGKITISDNGNGTGVHLTDNDSSKISNTRTTVQIKIPVVATVVQKFEPDGTMSMSVESPGPDNNQLIQDSINNAVDNHFNNSNNDDQVSNMEFLKESCNNMSISLPNSSGYMSFHADTSKNTIGTNDIQDLDIKNDVTNHTFNSIDLFVENRPVIVESIDDSHHQNYNSLSDSNNSHDSQHNYNFFNNEHNNLLTPKKRLLHYNNQFDSPQIIGEDLAQHKINDQHFNIQRNHNNSDIISDNNNLILNDNERLLYNEINHQILPSFSYFNNCSTNLCTNNNNNHSHIIDDHDDDDSVEKKYTIL